MPLIIKNSLLAQIDKLQKEQQIVTEAKPVIQNEPVVERPVIYVEEPVVVQQEEPKIDEVSTSGYHHTVVIGGKQKTIAKNSVYLIDMITIEK
jgi:hypothetical protein